MSADDARATILRSITHQTGAAMPTSTDDYEANLARLKAVFDLVANTSDWKMPVQAVIDNDAATNLDIEEAVSYFTGSAATINHLDNGTKQVLADGYYLAMVDPDVDL